MKEFRKIVESHILRICAERNLPTEQVLEKLRNFSDEQLEVYVKKILN